MKDVMKVGLHMVNQLQDTSTNCNTPELDEGLFSASEPSKNERHLLVRKDINEYRDSGAFSHDVKDIVRSAIDSAVMFSSKDISECSSSDGATPSNDSLTSYLPNCEAEDSFIATPELRPLSVELPLVARRGVDISKHYVMMGSGFSIFRYEGSVYALNKGTNETALLWKSHNKEELHVPKYLARGNYGAVYKKTADKATKIVASEENLNTQELSIKNERLLEIKFASQRLGVADNFNLGLWNIKDSDNPRFIMPLINSTDDEITNEKMENFIGALFTLNFNNISHPDLASTCRHISRQNVMNTTSGLIAIDMDEPMIGAGSLKDQWLWFANPNNPHIVEYYEANPGVNLTDKPIDLEILCMKSLESKHVIYIPLEVQNSLGIKSDYRDLMEFMGHAKWNYLNN